MPLSLQNCTEIVKLDLSEKEFTGNSPVWIGERFSRIMILILQSNKFHSLLLKELCHLISLQILDLTDNNLFGNIPRCINNFNVMMRVSEMEQDIDNWSGADFYSANLEDAVLVNKGAMAEYNTILNFGRIIDLSKNNFFGEIHMEVVDFLALQSLILSHNSFTSRIPKNIGAMIFLESIDFSGNQLFDEIPQSISNLTFLSVFNLSNNRISGKIPLSTQLQGFNASCFTGVNLN
ncbi:receptor-like protein EIX2 [Mangifera indica]|uniref:receptor-like protein EIX2 n=1 Tax=Mangifera indica TaxID=29780 RepID=UPI001CFA16EC|nr:receptor-like protein EIX2 [Mangifera indica]